MKTNEQNIRYSTDDDLNEILKWLKAQEDNDIEGTFYCNRNLTISEHEEGRLIVYVNPKTNLAIGYQWGGLITPGIIEIHNEFRGQGIGKQLVDFRINEARAKRKTILKIQCTPTSSIPFWEHMGFTLSVNMENTAYMLLNYKNELPPNCPQCSVRISFFPEKKKWEKDTTAEKTFTPEAVYSVHENKVYLSERVSHYDSSHKFNHDLVISISVNGVNLYLDKAKYEEARSLGVKSDLPAFYMDTITMPHSHQLNE